MPRDENISADTSGRSGDIGGSQSGGKAGNDPLNALKSENPQFETDVSGDEHSSGPQEGTPDDLKLGKRRTVGMDEDGGAGSDMPGSQASD